MTTELQAAVVAAVRARGYLRGNPEAERRQQCLKALEELGEGARCLFDNRPVPVDELADVVIPLLCLAALQSADLLAAVLHKANADSARGVRAMDTTPDRVPVRCRVTGDVFPAIEGGGHRYAAAGDIIHVAPDDATALVQLGMAEAL